jgi:predicted DNA-binding transcriptional regulator AlpA
MEILTAAEVAALLRVSKRQVYELCKDRTHSGDVRDNPLPAIRFGSSVRFRKSDVEAWIDELVAKGKP